MKRQNLSLPQNTQIFEGGQERTARGYNVSQATLAHWAKRSFNLENRRCQEL